MLGLDCIKGLASRAFNPDQDTANRFKKLATAGFAPDIPVLFFFCSRVY